MHIIKILLQVGDDGSVLAATEDEVFRSLIGEPNDGLSPLDPDINDVIEDDKDKEGSDDLVLDGDDLSVRADISKHLHIKNLCVSTCSPFENGKCP